MNKKEVMKRCILRALAINSELTDEELENVAYEFWDEELEKQAKQEKAKEIFDDLEKEKYANPCMKCGSVLCSICSDDIKEVKQKHLGKTKEAKDNE